MLLRQLCLSLSQRIGGGLLSATRGVQVRRGLVRRRHGVVTLLARDGAVPQQILVALHICGRPRRLGFCGGDLRARLFQATARGVDLTLRGQHGGLGLLHASAGRSLHDASVHERRAVLLHCRPEVGPRLLEAFLEVPGVELHEQIARLHVRIVVDVHASDVARDLGAYRHDMGIDERVVGGLVRPRVQDVSDPVREQPEGRDDTQHQQHDPTV